MKKKKVILTFLLVVLVPLCIYEWSTYFEKKIILPEKSNNLTLKSIILPENSNNLTLKSILLWNDLFGKENWGFPRSTNYDFKGLGCRVQNCFITTNREFSLDADAVIFHIFGNLNSRPKFKPANQLWVFLMHEPPCLYNFNSLRQWNSLFNWTMTYRLDSDIPIPYVHTCKKRERKVNLLKKDIMEKKKRLAAWMVSNCNSQSQRNQYMNELLKYIPVDIFGQCSALFGQNNKCEKNDEENCMNMISNQYKFYFSFENSLSVDYATEKFIKVLNTNAVPVVRGDANYTVLGPPNSFIDTKKFKSAKHLAEYLLKLDQNEIEYLEFLKWKEDYESHDCGPGDIVQKRFCNLCEKLNSPQSVKSVYTNIYDWYHRCREPDDLNV